MANRDYGKNSSPPTKKMADGGSVGESVGFWERIKAGNIDERGSEAYNRWNKDAKADTDNSDARQARRMDEVSAPAAAPAVTPAPAAPVSVEQDAATSSGLRDKTPAADTKVEELKPIESRAVNRVAPSGKSLGSGMASSYAAMQNSKAAHAALQKKSPAAAAVPSKETPVSKSSAAPEAPAIIRDGPNKNTSLAEDWGDAIGSGFKRFSKAAANPGMANGGPVGDARYYGKK